MIFSVMSERQQQTPAERGENTYRSILKATSVFGGVQFFHILVSLVRGKLVAMFLGPAGMGISALYVSSTATVQKFASLGLNLAIVKEAGHNKDDPEALATVVAVARRMTLLTGLLGALICVACARFFSLGSFGDTSHTFAYMALGAMVFFSIAGNGEMSLLQGVHDVRRLSRATVVGSLGGLFVSVPLYYYYGVRGIVPAMIVMSLLVYLFYFVSARKAMPSGVPLRAWREHKALVRQLLSMGIVLMSGDLAGNISVYALQAYIRVAGDVSDVGLFQGANSLTIQYSGVVFAALAMDYFPRLSAAASDNAAMASVVNRQIEIVSCLVAPLATALIICAPLVVRILLTEEFAAIVGLLRWMGFALLVQGLMFPLGYVTFAKNNKKVYFWTEVIGTNVMILVFSMVGYRLWGLVGLGYATVADKLFWLPACYMINYRLYGCRMERGAFKSMALAFAAGVAVFVLSMAGENAVAYVAMCAVWLVIVFVALRRIRYLFSVK